MESAKTVEPHPFDFLFPTFDGYPYISVELLGAIPHVILLPRGMPIQSMKQSALFQAVMNQLNVYLGLAKNHCYHFTPDGSEIEEPRVQGGAYFKCDNLLLAVEIPQAPELDLRRIQLEKFIRNRNQNIGAVAGDPEKGGHRATPDEFELSSGRQPNGAPKGLQKCAHCGEWKGGCLDPDTNLRHLLMRVHCLCDNHNRCARCGQLLYHRKLNANFYEPTRDAIWFVPGFCAFDHTCSTESARTQ